MEHAVSIKPMRAPPRLLDWAVRRFSHPWQPMALYLPLGAFLWILAQRAEPREILVASLWVIGGVFTWSFVEYLLHRFVFHWTAVREPWRSMASGLHMAHHRTADTADLILAPPVVSLIFGAMVYGALSLFTWSWTRSALMMIGIFLGYLAYEWVHYGAHRFKMQSPLGKFLKQQHLRHHFKEPRRCFGVTSPFWDWAFGTLSNKK